MNPSQLFYFLICLIFLLFVLPLSNAQTPPQTTIISGPSGITEYEDITFWWINDSFTPIIGYYYELDERGPVFTESNRVSFFGLDAGTHTFRVSGVDANGIEDKTPDERNFQVELIPQVELEFNDVSSLSTFVRLNHQLRGSSIDAGDLDWYKFQIPSDGHLVSICLKRAGGIGQTTAQVYRGSDTNKIAELIVDESNAQRACITLGVVEGDYFILVQAQTVDAGFDEYFLTVPLVSLTGGVHWDTERNDVFGSANSLTTDADNTFTIIGDRNFENDLDWFKLHIPVRQQLRISLDRSGAADETIIELFRSPLSSGDMSVNQIGRLKATLLTGQHAQFQTTVTLGDYFFKIDNGLEANNQPYIISVMLAEIPDGAVTEIEPNNVSPFINPNVATPLPMGEILTGTNWDGDTDVDWFRVDVPSTLPMDEPFLHLSLARPVGVGSTTLELFNPNMAQSGQLTISVDSGQQGQIAIPLEGGVRGSNIYAIKLTPQGESTSAEYHLMATLIQSLTLDTDAQLSLDEPLTVRMELPPSFKNEIVEAFFDLVGDFGDEIATSRTKQIPLPLLNIDAVTGRRQYVGQYMPVPGDDVIDAIVVVHLSDGAPEGLGERLISLTQPITIDTISPKIQSITHDGSGVLVAKDALIITLTGDTDAKAEFEISSPITAQPVIRIPQVSPLNDGFQASYTVKNTDQVADGIVVGRLIDVAGNVTIVQADRRVTILGDAPKIQTASHNGDVPLGRNETLTVTLTASVGGSASFAIDSPITNLTNLVMFDDEQHDDGVANDGVYAGFYTVTAGDDFNNALVSVQFRDAQGNVATLNLPNRVTLDGTPPAPVRVLSVVDVPDDEGFALSAAWDENPHSNSDDLSHYNLYLAERPIRDVVGLSPTLTEVTTTSVIVPTPENDAPFFLAVTAVDRVGNESTIAADSAVGPVHTIDNLPPQPVVIVTAIDTPDDFGGSVTVSWTQPSVAADFDHYNLYTTASPNIPIVQLPNFPIAQFFSPTPTIVDVPTPADDVDLFFAVTAVDRAGNESAISSESIAGPARSIVDVELQPPGVIRFDSGPIGLIRHNNLIFRWNRIETGNGRYFYQFDDALPQSTPNTRLILSNLAVGTHRILRSHAEHGNEEDGETAERRFTIIESTLVESEPNDVPAQGMPLPLGWTVLGNLEPAIDYYRLAIQKRGIVDFHYSQTEGETHIRIYRGNVTSSNQIAEAQIDVSNNQTQFISFGVVPGNYFIALDRQIGGSTSYELSTAFSPDDGWETEPNNDGTTATPLLLNKPIRGTSWRESEADADWYRINVGETGLLIINFLRESIGGETRITLHDASGGLIATNSQPSGSIVTSIAATVGRGSYFIEVAPIIDQSEKVDPFSDYHLVAAQIGKAEFQIDDGTTSPPENVLTLGDRLNVLIATIPGGFSHGEARSHALRGNELSANFSLPGIQSGIPLTSDDDGYSATFSVPDNAQLADVPIVVQLIDAQRLSITFELTPRVNIDTRTSPIHSMTHDAETALVAEDTLTVTLEGIPDASVQFEIVDADTDEVVIPTSRFSVEHDSAYVSHLTVRDGDFVPNGRIVGRLTKPNGRTVTATATRGVQIDAVPPEPVTGVQGLDVPNDEGKHLEIIWESEGVSDSAPRSHALRGNELYLQRQPFSPGKITGIEPVLRTIGDSTAVVLPVDTNNVDYFIAVIVVDAAGNSSVVGENSSIGPIQAIDNLPPPPVATLTAFDTPDDLGGMITLQWTRPSGAADFDHYNIYRSEQPFVEQPGEVVAQLNNRHLTTTDVPTSADEVALYFAITGVDQSGNESALAAESVFGPVQSINNVATSGHEPNLNFIRGPTGLIRHNDVVFHWNRSWPATSDTFRVIDRFIYRLDNLPAQSTTDTSVAFFDLPNGPHRFTLQPADGPNSPAPIVQSFTVNVNTLAESEPNETPATANPITVGMTHLGTLAELDLYRLDVENLASAFYVDLLYAQNDGETDIKIFQNRIADDAQIAQAHVSPDTQGRAVLSFAVTPATYLIAFEEDAGNEIPYRFSISTSPIIAPNLAEIEPNATLNAAVHLPLNRAIMGTSWEGNSDLDYYQIDVPEAGILWVGLTRTDGIGSTTLALIDGSEAEVSTVEISPNSLNVGQIQAQILPGRYFLRITPQNTRSGSAYQLSAFFVRSAKYEPAVIRPLRLGETLRVTVEAATDLTPAFEIVQSQTNAVLVSSSRFVAIESSDSKYQGEYIVSEGDNFEGATVVVRLMNAFGNIASIAIDPPIFVDTVPPVIQSVSHSATQPDLSAQPLGIGAELVVTLIGEGNGQAFFKIEELGVSVELNESEEILGHYVGTYQIKDRDNAESVSLTATLIDAAGNATVRPMFPVIKIDTTPPSITKVQHNGTKVLTESDELVVTLIGEAGGSAEFDIEGVIAGVRMFDDGTHDDGIASDGIYIGVYRIRPGDRADEAALTVRLTDAVGNASTRSASDRVTIDTLLPQIDSITHDAVAPLALGEILTIELIGEAGAEVQFEIIDADTEIVIIPAERFLVEMNQIDESPLVSYVSHFIVRDGDVVTSGKVRATLTKENGKSITRTILRPITIDTTPPDPVTEVVSADRPNDEGGWIILSWRGSEADDFDHYNIYYADFPISQIENNGILFLQPGIGQNAGLNLPYEIEIDRNDVDFHFVVTAVDKAGNESGLSTSLPVEGQTSSTASARAIDNLAPGPVLGVTASDTPGDFGGRVILAWLNPSVASDFDHYRVYLSPLPIQTTEGLRPILTIPDRRIINVDALTPIDEVDYFLAVTAVDVSGNESILENSSTTGPIQSRNNIGVGVETPVQIVSGPIGIVRQTSVTFHFSEISFSPGGPVFAYSLDDAPFQLTQANRATFYNLREGNHTFAVRLAEARGSQTSRTFSVLPTFTTEVEPNDVPIFANPLTQNAIVRGVNALDSDEDWYRIEFTPPLIDESMPLQIDLHFERPAGIGQTTISVFDIDLPQENAVLSQVRGDATTRQRAQLSLGVSARTNGFLVRVQSERENPGAGYELSLAVVQRDRRSLLEIERNDFTNTPTILPLTEAVELIGRHDHANDVDWYRLDLTPVGTRLLSISFSSAMNLAGFSESLETSLQIFANLQGTPDAQIAEMALSPLNPEPPPITTAVTTGPYLLRVASNDTENATGITYRLLLQLQEIPDGTTYEIEPNNRRSRATPIEIDAEVRGGIWHPIKDETDWFRLPIRQAGIFSLGLHRVGLDEDTPLSMRLTDANGVEFATEMSGTLSLDVVQGEYFIEVNTPLETDASPYTLILLLIASASHNAVDEILGTGSELTVTLNWNPGREAMFEVTSATPIPNIRVPMVEAEAGIYVGKYLVPPNLEFEDGKVVLTLGSGNQVDNLRYANRLSLKEPIAIDTLLPKITRVSHSGVRPNGELQPIGVGQSVHIRLIGEVGANGMFSIDSTSRFRIVGDLFDDGAHDDDAADDGIYGGSYTVRLGDNVAGATVIGRLEDLAGNAAERVASKLITFDTEPPSITAISLTVTRNNRVLEHPPASVSLLAGDQLTVALTGEIGGEATFELGTLQTDIPLFDDGTRGDLQSNDGVYTTIYIVRDVDSVVNATITGRLRDAAGNENEMISPILVSIDTTPPAIAQIEHNGTDRPFFVSGDKLIVQLHGEPGGVATFDIGNFKTAIIMVDDGSGVDVQANDGIYAGIYEVTAGDNAVDTVIIGQLIDASGNRTVVPAGTRITIDAVPPAEITGINASDRLNDQGNVLIVTWEVAKSLPDFARYNVYREAAPIRSTFGLIPIPQNLVLREQTVSEIPVPRNDFNYYIAVTAVDLAGNESILSIENGSSVGPIRALDNIAPPAIVGVAAKDKPDDNGVTLIVNWEPIRTDVLETNTIHNDFGRYLIYVDTQSIESVENLKPWLSISDPNTIETEVTIPADDTDFYIAITAIDENENESALDLVPDGSTFGPVKSHDETPPEPVINLVAIDTPGDRGESLTIGWTPQIGVGISHYQVYLSTYLSSPGSTILPIRSADDLEGVDSIRVDGERSDFVNLTTPTDEFGFYVAIAAVDFGGNWSGLDSDGGSVFGPVQSVSNTIRATARTTISAGFDPNTKIVLPPRAASDGQTIDIFIPTDEILLKQIDEANHFLVEAHIDEQIDGAFQNTVREFLINGNNKFSIAAELTLSYPAETQPALSPEIENDLRIFSLNTKGRVPRWELVGGIQRVDREERTVTAFVDTLTTFRVARLKLPNTLDNVVVVPNPFIPAQSVSRQVTFLNLTVNATIEIYTLNGARVWSKTVENATGTATWDGRNESGIEVASGLYIYVVRSDVDKFIGRLMVMR